MNKNQQQYSIAEKQTQDTKKENTINFKIDNVLGDGAFWKVNKRITIEVGIIASTILADLISKRSYFRDRGQLDKFGGFFNTADNLNDDLQIKRTQRENATKKLIKAGFIKKSLYGMPRRSHWYIQDDKIASCLLSTDEKSSSMLETNKLTVGNQQTSMLETNSDNKNKQIRIKNKNKESKPEINLLKKSKEESLFDNDIRIIKELARKRFRGTDNFKKKYLSAIKRTSQDDVSKAILGYCQSEWHRLNNQWKFEKLLRNDEMIFEYAEKSKPYYPKQENKIRQETEQEKLINRFRGTNEK